MNLSLSQSVSKVSKGVSLRKFFQRKFTSKFFLSLVVWCQLYETMLLEIRFGTLIMMIT